MTHAVVTIEVSPNKCIDLALPINVPSRVLASSIAQALKLETRENTAYTLIARSEKGLTRLLPNMTLSNAGILDGYILQLEKSKESIIADYPYPVLRSEMSEMDKIFPLDAPMILIGRQDIKHGLMVDLDLTPYDNDSFISRRHAKIEKEEDNFYLSDLKSINGTRINDRRIDPLKEKVLLQDGDQIRFGKGNIIFTFIAKK